MVAQERLITSAEVLQEILHRYVAIGRKHMIQRALDALLGVADEVFPIERSDVEQAQSISGLIATPRFYAALLSTFAVLAFLLSAVGVYGSMMYSVGLRRREMGIRLALDAARGAWPTPRPSRVRARKVGDVESVLIRAGRGIRLAGAGADADTFQRIPGMAARRRAGPRACGETRAPPPRVAGRPLRARAPCASSVSAVVPSAVSKPGPAVRQMNGARPIHLTGDAERCAMRSVRC